MRKITTVLSLASILAATASCSGHGDKAAAPAGASRAAKAMAAQPAPPPGVGKRFRNGNFEITVTKVTMKVAKLAPATARTQAIKPAKGQFIVVYLTAKNVGSKPASMSLARASLVDTMGKIHLSARPEFNAGAGQGLGAEQKPGVSRTGWIAFDVPASVTQVGSLVVQSDPAVRTKNPATVVRLI